MIETKSNCFQALPKDFGWGEFLPAEKAVSVRDHLHARLGQPKWFYYERFRTHGVPKEAGVAAISSWPGTAVLVAFLDLTDPRVLRLRKAHLKEFFDEYVYPTEETYFVSEDGKHLICFDHEDSVHQTGL